MGEKGFFGLGAVEILLLGIGAYVLLFGVDDLVKRFKSLAGTGQSGALRESGAALGKLVTDIPIGAAEGAVKNFGSSPVGRVSAATGIGAALGSVIPGAGTLAGGAAGFTGGVINEGYLALDKPITDFKQAVNVATGGKLTREQFDLFGNPLVLANPALAVMMLSSNVGKLVGGA